MLLGTAAAVCAVAAFGAVAATRTAGAAPAVEPLPQAIHDALTAPAPAGVTARIAFTNNLLPSSSMLGNAASALLSGASGRLWLTGDGDGRIELQSGAGDTQIVWQGTKLTVYDASSDTVYEATLPQRPASSGSSSAPPSVDRISAALARFEQHANVSGAVPGTIAGQPAYDVTVSPKGSGGLFGDAELAWDAANGVPLRVSVTAKGASSPVLELAVTDISFGAVPSSDVDVSPPANAKVVDLGTLQPPSRSTPPPVTGVAAVRAAVPFPLVAPASAGGQALGAARLAGKGAVLVYGHGLGALVVYEHAAPATGSGGSASPELGSLPAVTIGPVSGHELGTPLGTVITFDNGGVSFVVAGSMTSTDAEAAAQAFV